ncbi:MAG: hypothetical protein ACXV79_13890, partial [Methylobacter sp.]
MIGFILCSFSLAVLVQNQSEFLRLLSTPVALGVGVAVMAVSLLAGYLKKAPTIIWHDGFATSALLVWYAYWAPQFDDDAPMFFFFPLYYSLLTSIVTVALINKSQDFDLESIRHLRYLDKNSRFNIGMIIALVLVSLVITRHYALYPIAMTFFV